LSSSAEPLAYAYTLKLGLAPPAKPVSGQNGVQFTPRFVGR